MLVTFKQDRFGCIKEHCSQSVTSADEEDLAILSNSVLWLCCRVPCGVESLFQQRFGSRYSMYCVA